MQTIASSTPLPCMTATNRSCHQQPVSTRCYGECVARSIHSEGCSTEEHKAGKQSALPATDSEIERCARIFRVMGEPARMRIIARLTQVSVCVGDLAAMEGESITTMSQRLRVCAQTTSFGVLATASMSCTPLQINIWSIS